MHGADVAVFDNILVVPKNAVGSFAVDVALVEVVDEAGDYGASGEVDETVGTCTASNLGHRRVAGSKTTAG